MKDKLWWGVFSIGAVLMIHNAIAGEWNEKPVMCEQKEIALDIERQLLEKGVSNYQNLSGKTNIEELISQIASLDLIITGDSGPMHLAAAYQIPTVSIFGPTNDIETSQWTNKKNIIVKKNLDCQPCMKRTCPLKHHNCMVLIQPSEVLIAVKSLI